MHNCELFSIRKNKADAEALTADLERVSDSLSERGVEVGYKTDVSADPVKIADAVMTSLRSGESDVFILANALNTSDSSSFKKLFYELITRLESELEPDEAHKGMTPKIKVLSLGDMGRGYKGYCFKYKGKVFIATPSAALADMDISDMLCLALIKTDETLTRARSEYPAGITYPEEKRSAPRRENTSPGKSADAAKGSGRSGKKKENFFLSFIPRKGDSRGAVARKIVVLVAIVAFIGALIYVADYFIFAPMQNNAISSEIQSIAYRQNTDETTADGEPLPEQNWKALKKINKEIVGWIRMDNTPIDYPVLYRKSDDQNYQHYLKHTYKGDYSEYGSIFVDYRCKKSTQSKNVILHGHNMLNGSMFHELVNYSDRFSPKLNYYKKHAVLTFNTPDGDSKWKVISVFKTSTLYAHGEFFNYMQAEFNSDAEFMNFVYNMRIRSMFNIPVTVNEDDQILTLSTCSYEFTSFRTVLVARKVRPGEDESVDVALATVNNSPLYPDVYYQANGGTRPDPLTFKTASEKGLVNWYDGKGDLEGSEDLTATIAANPTEPPTKKGETLPTQPAVITYYQIIYRNVDGKQIAAYNVREGDPVPVPDIVPTYEDDAYIYNFVRWDYDVEGVDFEHLNCGVDIYPVYDYVAK